MATMADRPMKAVSVLKVLAGTRIEHTKTCPRAPPGRSRIWQKAARRQPKAALEPSFDASKRDPKRKPEKIPFRTRKQRGDANFLAPILGAKINKKRFRRGSRSGSSFGPRFLEVCSRKLRFSGPHLEPKIRKNRFRMGSRSGSGFRPDFKTSFS